MTDASAEQGASAPRYDFERIDLDSGSVHADVVRLAGENMRVLELGPATGYMTKAFVERGCTVVGIELDAAMAERAEEFCERVIVGDLDRLDLESELGEDRFDVVVAADVLEHLRDPLAALERLRAFLRPDGGAFVISVPNVAHGSVRLALLGGQFEYRDIGLLDSTHLHFFTRQSFEQLLDEAELGLAELHRHDLNFDASEVSFDPDTVPPSVREEIEADPDARTYQFVAKAIPMSREGLREIQARLRELAELRRAVIDAHDQLLRRDSELEELRMTVARVEERSARREGELERVNNELVAARNGLERIRASAPFRLYASLKELPGLSYLRRRRQAAFDAEVAKRTGRDS